MSITLKKQCEDTKSVRELLTFYFYYLGFVYCAFNMYTWFNKIQKFV